LAGQDAGSVGVLETLDITLMYLLGPVNCRNMKCLKCQFDNKEGAKFCGKCGAKLALVCPQCNSENDPENNFCNECGRNLTPASEPASKELSFDEKLDKIQRYLPEGLTEKILARRDRIEGERKLVTVMFCDLQGFSALSEKLGPEEAYSLMDEVYEILIHKVHDYEGTVNEMTGDGIVALFGAPIALEDAPQRAIRSSLAIHREISKFSDKMKQDNKAIPPLKMRIGIHTGPVVVGTLGNNLRVEFKAVGDTVNLASRMEGLAEPGTTYVTDETYGITEGFFRFEALGTRKVRGKKNPINAYRVIAPSTRRTRFDVSAERGLTPFVGRERELELLIDGFERSKEGRGQAFSIVAEAGVGKSRLLYELRKAVANENITFLEGKCLSFSQGVAYHPVIDVLKSNFDIQEGDGDSEIRQKVIKGIEMFKIDEGSTLPYLLELLAVKERGSEHSPLSPEMRQKRIIEALIQIILKGSEIRPLIIAIEDLHWIDTSSEGALKLLLDSISGSRVFLIFTYRSEFAHTWGGRSYHSQVNLNRLSNRETIVMISDLLSTDNIDNDLEELILEKTEGIPFFIEEFIKSLKDLKIIEREENRYYLAKNIQDLILPSSIQEVIMARIDTLPEAAKLVLQTASVVGREFNYDLLKRVRGLQEQEIRSHLSVLRDSGLIYERGIYPHSTFIFKHALTQEVSYNSLLQKRRTEIHDKIALAIEALYPERLEEFYEMLAYHYSKSDNSEKAYQYLKFSGNKATKNYSNREAFRFYKEAIDVLTKMPETTENKSEQIEVRLLTAFSMFLLNFPEDSLEILQTGERLSKELEDERSLAHFLSLIGQYYGFKGENLLLGIKYSEDSFKAAEKINDIELMVPIGMDLCILYWRVGEFFKLIDLASKVFTLLDKTQRQSESFRRPYNVYSMLLAYYAQSMGMLGNFEEGTAMLEKGLDFALEIKDLTALALVESHYGTMLNFRGDAKKAIAHFQNSIRYCEEGQFVVLSGISRVNLGWSYCLLGEFETAREYMEKGFKIQIDGGANFHLCYFYRLLSLVHLESGDLKNAQQRAEEALKLSQKDHEKWDEGLAWILLGRIFGKGGESQINRAEECILQGIKILNKLKLKPLYAPGYHYLGELYADTGQQDKALGNLKKAEGLFREMGMGYWVTKTQEVLEKFQT
jgi:class 3 adenylate cyclase/tetratricopeptide (TPR) repeat protein